MIRRGEVVLSRDGRARGRTTGSLRSCTLEGCRGLRIGVRWPDGRLTWPCSEGMVRRNGTLRIL